MDVDAIRAARRELDEVIEEIRHVPGYEQFLAPPTFEDVARSAEPGPLVYLAAAELGGLGLVVRGTDVVHVPLDELTAENLRTRVTGHLQTYADYRADRERHRADWYASLDRITAWLWTVAMGPVLECLEPDADAVFVPGGLLGLLPLHAAWTPDPTRPTGRRYALDVVPFSYAPNARSLQVARTIAAESPPSRLLAVVEPRPVRASPLPAARYEAMSVQAWFGSAAKVLPGGEATPRAFLREAVEADVLHLACHGYADLRTRSTAGSCWPAGRSSCATCWTACACTSGSPCCPPARRHCPVRNCRTRWWRYPPDCSRPAWRESWPPSGRCPIGPPRC